MCLAHLRSLYEIGMVCPLDRHENDRSCLSKTTLGLEMSRNASDCGLNLTNVPLDRVCGRAGMGMTQGKTVFQCGSAKRRRWWR